VVEGTPLLRAQTGNRLEGSNPFVSATKSLNWSVGSPLRGNGPSLGGINFFPCDHSKITPPQQWRRRSVAARLRVGARVAGRVV
jgi:hypothetical protein